MKRITLALQAPYVGLRPFSEREALLFFGREQHVRELLTKLEGRQRFIAVLGASGTGKSSLVRAGLVPALHRGSLVSAGYNWTVCIFKPGDAPLTNLAQALTEHPDWRDSDDRADAVASLSAALAMSPLSLTELYRQKTDRLSGQALLLVVDQFEEIFRYRQRNVDEAESFINLLLRSASEDVPIYVVMTMRSDFLGHCVSFFGLPEAINKGLYLTPRLGPEQLKSIIASPLSLVGGEIDPLLVTKLVNTLGGEDELPVLEHALLRMWNRVREAGRTSLETNDFETVCAPHDGASLSGGLAKLSYAINNHASEIHNTLPSHQQVIARRLFIALVERRDGQEVRQPQTVKQLVELVGQEERGNLLAVIEAFRANDVGFLLPTVGTSLDDERMIDISHESLFRQWRLFRQWLDEEEVDVAELREWQQRTARQIEGGSWLDEYDGERAARWCERVKERGNPEFWVKRYHGPVQYREVNRYIEESLARVQGAKAEKERLEREAREAETRRLELEAQVQRDAAVRAVAERLQAEKEKRQAQAYAESSRGKARMALACFLAAVVVIGLMLWSIPMRVLVELTTESVQFEIGAPAQGETTVGGFNVQSIAIEKFADLSFEPASIEVADPAQYRVETDDFPPSAWRLLNVDRANISKVTLGAKDPTRHPRVTVEGQHAAESETFHLYSLAVAPGMRVTLATRKIFGGKREGVTLQVTGQDTLTLSIEKPFRLIADQVELRGISLPFRQQDELTYRVTLPEQSSWLAVTALSSGLILSPTFASGQSATSLVSGIPVASLNFTIQGSSGEEVSSLTGEGVIIFPDYPHLGSVPLIAGEAIVLEGLDKFTIEHVILRPDGKGMNVVGHGLVKQFRTKRGELPVWHSLTALEALWHNARLALFVTIMVTVFTVSLWAYWLRKKFKQ